MYSNSVLEIDLSIIKDNYRRLKQLCSSEVAAAVKANAYGLGATQVVKSLMLEGCRKYFVADLQEALELRREYKSINIYVLCGVLPETVEYFPKYNLIPVVNHLGQIEILNNFCRSKNIKYSAILHVDTGMNRLGMPESETLSLVINPELRSNLNFEYIMSHLASSEEGDNQFNKTQLDKFYNLKYAFPGTKGSIANSAAILLGPDYHLDLVRPGAAIYGLNLNEKMSVFCNPIRLFSKLLQVKEVQSGQYLGYNQTYKVDKNAVIGTITLGYADGISRNLSNNGKCYINGIEAPIIGRVSMDLINIDLNKVPEQFRSLGQEVDIICELQTPDSLARKAGTIGYEVLTSLGNRYERRYLNAEPPKSLYNAGYEIFTGLREKYEKKYLNK